MDKAQAEKARGNRGWARNVQERPEETRKWTSNVQERQKEPGAGQGTSRKGGRNQELDKERAGKAGGTRGWTCLTGDLRPLQPARGV